jgi:hypothetical protein
MSDFLSNFLSNYIPSKIFSIAVTSSLMLLSHSITAESKPIKTSVPITFDFKGCVNSLNGNDVICAGSFRSIEAEKFLGIYKDKKSVFDVEGSSITDSTGKKYVPDEIRISNGKSCKQDCNDISVNLVEGVDYKIHLIFEDISLPSSKIPLLQIGIKIIEYTGPNGGETLKFRNILLSKDRSSLSEIDSENNTVASKPIKIIPDSPNHSDYTVPDDRTQSPEQMLKTYFATVLNRDYKKAWSMISSDAQSDTSVHPNGYSSFVEQGKKTGGFDVKSAKLISQNNQQAIVNVDVNLASRIIRFQYTLKKDIESGNWLIFKGRYR